jgi:hypothetical protein
MLAVLPAFALCLLAPRPVIADTRLTLRSTGSVAALLEALSAKAGVSLTATPRLAREVLIVSLTEVPLSDAMARVAWATFGQWERVGEGFRLARDGGEENRAEREYREAAIGAVSSSFAAFRSRALTPGLSDSEVRAGEARLSGNPYVVGASAAAVRAFARLSSSVTPGAVAGASQERQATFSSAPSPVERSLGADAPQVLKRYVAERGLPPETQVRATIYAYAGPRGGAAMLTLWDGASNVLDRSMVMIGGWDKARYSTPKEIADAIPANMAVPLSPVSEFFRQGARDRMSPTEFGPGDFSRVPEVIQRLRDPEKFEPLATFVTDVWVATAKKTGRNLVANVDDDWFVPAVHRAPPTLREMITAFWLGTFKADSGWLAIRPLVPNSPWPHRIDRKALGRYARTSSASDSLAELEAAAAFVSTAGVPEMTRCVSRYMEWATEGKGTSNLPHEWALPRFYGSLPEAARRAWLAGEPVDVSKLGDSSLWYLRTWAAQASKTSDLPVDATRLFPHGLPSGWLRSEERSTAGFFIRAPIGGSVTEFWGELDQLSAVINSLQPGGKGDRVEIQEAPMRKLRLFADLGPGLQTPEKVFRISIPDPNKYFPWRKASAELRGRIEAEMARQRGAGQAVSPKWVATN